jgi:hypothetical protein
MGVPYARCRAWGANELAGALIPGRSECVVAAVAHVGTGVTASVSPAPRTTVHKNAAYGFMVTVPESTDITLDG